MKNVYFSLIIVFVLLSSSFLKATDYYLKSTGGITALGSWGTNTNGSGTSPTNFTTAGDIWHFANRTTLGFATGNPNFPSTSTVIIESSLSLTISGTASFGSARINTAANSTLTLSKSISNVFNSIDIASTVVFNNAGMTVPSTASGYGNVTIAVSTALNGAAGDIHIGGVLTLNASRTLSLSGYVLYLDGTTASVAGTGSLAGDPAAAIALTNGNGGNNGTLRFSNGAEQLFVLDIAYGSGANYFTLGSNLTITGSGVFAQTTGGIDLNGNTLTLDNTCDANFPIASSDGELRGTNTSNLVIEALTIGNGGGSNIIYMNSSNNSIKSFTFNSPGNTIQLGSTMNLIDNLDVLDGTFDSNGFLVLKADATRSARIGPIGATGAITGNASVETFAPGGFTGWTNMGVSGISGQTINNWQNNPIPMTCTGCLYDPSSVGGFASIQGWDEATNTYVSPLTSATALTPGTGFWVYLGNGSVTTSGMTWSFTGPLVTGNVNVPLSTINTGFNLLANPYASPISWDQVVADNGLSGATSLAIYIFNPDLGVTTTYEPGVGSSHVTGGATNVIPAGQGFYFEAGIFDASVTFSETQKLTDNTSTNPLLKGAASREEKNSKRITRLKLTGALDWDMTLFNMAENSSFNKSKGDAWKIFQSPGYQGLPGPYTKYTTISSRTPNGEDLSINTFPATSNSVTIPVLVRVSTTGNYTISAQDFENWPSCVVLRDKINGAMTDLTKNNYSFFISDTTAAPRFELIVCGSGAGAVEVNELIEANQQVFIQQTSAGTVVKTNFEQNTKATISVYNVIGQKIMQDVMVEGQETNTLLNIDTKEQIAIIKVSTDKEVFTKKVVVR